MVVVVHPRQEIFGTQIGEGQHQVGKITLGVDHDGRDVVQGRFLEQPDAEAGPAAARHPYADPMGHEILGVVEKKAARLFRR
jgi:hypothetical protein